MIPLRDLVSYEKHPLQPRLKLESLTMLTCSFCLAPIITLESRKIALVCCGDAHSIAVDRYGRLFSWGSNQYGQLGYGDKEGTVEVNFVPK